MFIHLGENIVVRSLDVIAILDWQLLKESEIANEFIDKNYKNNLEKASGEAKSIVITVDQIYFSPLSSNTLKKRANPLFDLESTLEDEISL
jgi:extracellular matrix regulatory protein B